VAVVDDDSSVRNSLRFLLETAGYKVLAFASSDEFLAASSGCAACLLLDQHMPRMTGLELLRELRAAGSSIAVALMTGSPSSKLAQQALGLGAVLVMEKPVREEVLMQFLADHAR
jgi:two-component system response regulator FixJ